MQKFWFHRSFQRFVTLTEDVVTVKKKKGKWKIFFSRQQIPFD